MINLIPPEGHKVVKREYILRVGATGAFLLGWVCIFLTVSLVPTYVLIKAQIDTSRIEAKLDPQKEEAFKNAEQEVRTIEHVLAQLKTGQQTKPSSEVIESIRLSAPAGVTLNTVTLIETKGNVSSVSVRGIAPTREALATFKSTLEDSELFEAAEVPLSDLARDVNLPFTITVSLRET